MHFEVFASRAAAVTGDDALLTAQLAFTAADCAAAYAADPRYVDSVGNLGRVSLASDNVFRDNGAEALAAQTVTLTGNPVAGFQAG